MTSKKRLTELRTQVREYCLRWEANGGKLMTWECPYCLAHNDGPRPAKKDVGPKGYWDSVTLCYECGALSMVMKPVKGPAHVQPIQAGRPVNPEASAADRAAIAKARGTT